MRAGRLQGLDFGLKNFRISAEQQLARNKQIDREHLRQIHTALFAYKEAHGHFPEYLSQLAPKFLDPAALESPRRSTDGMNAIIATDHPDPALAQPAYGFEFSNLVFRDGRTFEDIKEVQRAEWGDAVPILRAFGYEKVINMAYCGDLYETDLNWEWDPATLEGVTDDILDAIFAALPSAEEWTPLP